MAVLSIPATGATPAYQFTTAGTARGVYVGEEFKGTVRETAPLGFFAACDTAGRPVADPGTGGPWTDERAAADFLARS